VFSVESVGAVHGSAPRRRPILPQQAAGQARLRGSTRISSRPHQLGRRSDGHTVRVPDDLAGENRPHEPSVVANTNAAKRAADVAEGDNAGIEGTPTFFINGVPIVGAVPYSDLQSLIDRELAAP